VTGAHALLRLAHIAAGFTALGSGLIPLLVTKGGRAHRLWGWVYAGSLGLASALALALAVRGSDLFMASLAVLTLYLLFSGLRAIRRRQASELSAATALDRAGPLLLLALSLASPLWYLTRPQGGWSSLSLVPLVFGALGALFAIRDLRSLRALASSEGVPFFDHFVRMLSSYIAATTAFSVTNLHALPPLVRWLWPTVLGTIGITLLARRFAREDQEQEEQEEQGGD